MYYHNYDNSQTLYNFLWKPYKVGDCHSLQMETLPLLHQILLIRSSLQLPSWCFTTDLLSTRLSLP